VARFTVLGAGGRIGRRLIAHLQSQGHAVFAPVRGDPAIGTLPLGHVVYAIGVTADFRTRPLETVQAHVCVLAQALARGNFDSLLYLSSTRVYAGAATGREDTSITVNSGDPSDLYNLSKLMGESLCLHAGRPAVRVARLSNVVGGDDAGASEFLSALEREARNGCIVLRSAPESAKDYVHIDDVVELLPRIALGGRARLYNLASGRLVSHRQWCDLLRTRTGCRVELTPGAPRQCFPTVDITRIRDEFGFAPRRVLPLPEEAPAP
jgi:nucleoside-diphosphate-sugar epimerase